jgi:hypothetical protein
MKTDGNSRLQGCRDLGKQPGRAPEAIHRCLPTREECCGKVDNLCGGGGSLCRFYHRSFNVHLLRAFWMRGGIAAL